MAPVPDTNDLISRLRTLPIFSDLTDGQLAWFQDHATERRLKAGESVFEEHAPADSMVVLLDGEIHVQRHGMRDAPLFIFRAGQVGGFLPYSRMRTYTASARVVADSRMILIHKDQFPDMLHEMPTLAERLVGLMSDRIRESTRMDQQRDKMVALGKISAGLAHELNNPAAAVGRSARALREELNALQQANVGVIRRCPSPAQLDAIEEFRQAAASRMTASPMLQALERSDREQELNRWLAQNQVADPWRIAPVLAEADTRPEHLENLHHFIDGPALGEVLRQVTAQLSVRKLAEEIGSAATRISELLNAVKEYSFMDRSPVNEVDVNQGIDSTLTILGSRLQDGVRVVRRYDPALPHITAFGSELNQVWTNLIDNAFDALKGSGTITIHTAREVDWILVEIIDDGPGVPNEIQSRIWEPFFTTKEVGEGLGIGLDTVFRIVHSHGGDVRMTSRPGETRFEVRLPISREL